jgi:hypothetical protein
MVTAQETYREMMKTQVAPALRGLGFKGSGQNYELPSPGHWAMLGFQKSAWSDASALRFTVNVLVVSRLATRCPQCVSKSGIDPVSCYAVPVHQERVRFARSAFLTCS